MVANAGGPVMSMYFLATRTPMQVFLGTAAWFFAIVNLAKVPFLAGLGLFTPQVLLTDLLLAPLVVAGGLTGLRLAKRMPQRLFDRIVIVLTVLGAVTLLF
ncbi:TSUP family transporter [Microbacterium sp. EF45047]|uniref:TSUP family transporter n=1 Tax=Microbacterium sp. EF45047 TaxID=2809708 RepID=UPI00300DC297